METHRSPIRKSLLAFVKLYRYGISPFFPGHCRFMPTCSQYAVQAIEEHGSIRGSRLAFTRLCRCHPWGDHGYDPVPPADRNN